MLKGKRSVSACSLSSCRIRAEALARAFNNRIWPCVWVQQRSSAEGGDGMSNGIEDEEEFFDASPSPVEVEDESLFCQQHSSAATEAGRAKLYELLQQHAADDAIDVFYDVSEDAGLTNTASDTCLRDDERESDQVDDVCKSSAQCGLSDDECRFSSDKNLSNGEESELTFPPVNQSSVDTVNDEIPDCTESQQSSDGQKQVALDPSTQCSSECDDCEAEKNSDDTSEIPSNEDNNILANENALATEEEESPIKERSEEENASAAEDEIPKETGENIHASETAESADLPSCDSDDAAAVPDENASNSAQEHSDDVSGSANAETTPKHEVDNDGEVKVTVDIESPSDTSDSSDAKVSSPTSRLQVFDEIRPKISRSTSLKTGKTPPGTPSRKKIVRFADVLGLDLEDVRHIMTGDVPIIPSSAYTDLDLKGTDLPSCEPISETIEISRRDSSGWNSLPGATATNVLYPMFAIPGEQPDFMDRLRSQGICLQTLIVSDMSVQCTCSVMNYGYYKKVIARYTVNDWQTSNDIDATYISGSSNGETDSFAFSIFLSHQNKNVKFALKYEVNGKEYWDNNRNQNYCLNYPMQHLPSPLWQDQFW